jgi:hypothetical protein
MDALAYKNRFEHSAFIWDSKFDDRRKRWVRFYTLEDKVAVEEEHVFDASTPLTSQIVVERFLDYGCDGDRERYLYRNLQVESFLRGLNLDHLSRGAISDVKTPLVLLDDRRKLGGQSAAVPENHESFRRTLSAYEFYKTLRDSVSHGTFICLAILTKPTSGITPLKMLGNYMQISEQCRFDAIKTIYVD